MILNYCGSGKIFFNHSEYQCDLYTNEDQGGIQVKINVNNPLASILELPFNIDFLRGEP